ncbi:MAG TPA: tyrosine-type recombinase/integrase [Vicinamibacterales bacterium]|nr:tyrosine-type recombinase/integrase [Vicinamibacterales bacterium]
MVEIIRKGELPEPDEVAPGLRAATAAAWMVPVREPRPPGFPLLFSAEHQLIEPAIAFLHEHAIQRAHTPDTLRTYMEILYDWFDALEQSDISWTTADAVDLVAYRNRMLSHLSEHTGRSYSVATINHRVRGVQRFYEWAVRNAWLPSSELIGRTSDFTVARRQTERPRRAEATVDRHIFLLRQFETLPRPLAAAQARELLAQLAPPYDLMARWQLYTGLRVSELLRLTVTDVLEPTQRVASVLSHRTIDVMRKGRKSGYVIASASLLDESASYIAQHRRAWLSRAQRRRAVPEEAPLFVNRRGCAVKKNSYQQVIHDAGVACGFKATTHLLRSTFACMMLARLEQLAKQGAAINPLLIVKVLMGHERIETTDRYLRAIAVDAISLGDLLDTLLGGS